MTLCRGQLGIVFRFAIASACAEFALSRHVGSSGSVAIQWGLDAMPWSTWNCLPLLHYCRLAVTVYLTPFHPLLTLLCA